MAARLVVFTMLCFSVCAHAQTQTLAVYSHHAPGFDSLTQHSLDQELTRLLSPAGIELAWRNEAREAREEMGRSIVGTFDGSCSVESLPSYPSDHTNSLALAESAMSDGRVIPYFNVDCPRVIRALAPTLQHLSVPFRHAVLGRALARVIAHEIYHILAQTADHEEFGLGKAQLSLKDLTSSKFDLSPNSLRRIRAAIQAVPPVPVAGLVAPRRVKAQEVSAFPSGATPPQE